MAKRRASRTPNQRSRDLAPSVKATFHQITGAGKSKVKRKFFGLSQSDEAAIEQEVGVNLDVNLNK